MRITIRQEEKGDFSAVFQLNQLAFGQNNEAKLVDALRINPHVFVPELSIVAVYNTQIVGHILFTRIHIREENKIVHESLALAPIAVDPFFQKKGIGSQLIIKGLETAKALDFQSVIVLGHEHYYPKFGFQPAIQWNIKVPFNVPSNAFMAIELVKGALINCTGIVSYPKEFESV